MNDERERYLTWVLVTGIIVAALTIGYLSTTPNQRVDPYTELYLEGQDGNASNYPQNLAVGESGTLTVGISNHEHRLMQYTVVYQFGNETRETQTVTIEVEDTWEGKYSFTPESAGRKQLQILLYRGEDQPSQSDPYRSVYLWVSVHETGTTRNT